MTYPANESDPVSAVRHACAAAGLDPTGAVLLHHYSNAIYHLPRENAVARVTTGADAEPRVRRTQAVARWLVDHHRFPATEPLPDTVPHAVDTATVVSFWTYYPPPTHAWTPTSAGLAALVRHMHRLELPPVRLTTWVPLVSLHATINDTKLASSITEPERQWINTRIEEVRDELTKLDWPLGVGLIHGDAWAGNLIPCPSAIPVGAVLGDWDWVAIGPREVDLIPTWHAATRYGKGPTWTQTFVDRYGFDLGGWAGYPVLMAMRDLVQLTGPIRRANDAPRYRAALRQRLDSLHNGTDATWVAL